ncbi:MAG: dihydroneopterin aldolase [Actinomycetota bacterium]
MDSIKIRELRVESRIGATEEERSRPQSLSIDLDVVVDLRAAGTSDDLAETVDYGVLVAGVANLVESSSCALLEHLAEKIAAHIANIEGVNGVTVEVAKDAPPIEQAVGKVSVRIERL